MWDIFVQGIGFVGMAVLAVSYQCTSNRSLLLWQILSCVIFATQFGLLSSWSGMFANLVGIVRCVLLVMGERARRWYVLAFLLSLGVLSFVMALCVFDEVLWIALLLLTYNLGSTLVLWTDNGKYIRIAQASVWSPIWIVNNVYYFSIAGIIAEGVNMTSSLLALYRYRKTGFTK
jgi:hypothetical protein